MILYPHQPLHFQHRKIFKILLLTSLTYFYSFLSQAKPMLSYIRTKTIIVNNIIDQLANYFKYLETKLDFAIYVKLNI